MQMQNKYLEQYDDLYGEDMHLIKVPLLRQEVRGKEALATFGALLKEPYRPPDPGVGTNPFDRIRELERQVAELTAALAAK